MKDKTIGEKIKYYRTRAGVSQFQLEMDMETSPGVISRIENGKINPTKETIDKIADVLNLNHQERAELHGIDGFSEYMAEVIELLSEISHADFNEDIINFAVNQVVFKLGLVAAFVARVDGDTLFAVTASDTESYWFVQKVIKGPFSKLNIDLKNDTENLLVRCVSEKKILIEDSIKPFIVKAVPDSMATLIEKVSPAKTCIAYPIINEKGGVWGTIVFGSKYETDFELEKPLLRVFVNLLGRKL